LSFSWRCQRHLGFAVNKLALSVVIWLRCHLTDVTVIKSIHFVVIKLFGFAVKKLALPVVMSFAVI
jgi:hypothetical protein